MQFHETAVTGAFVIEGKAVEDERGSFRRLVCARELAARGLEVRFVQSSLSTNKKAGTVRGLHLQVPPAEEAKLITCVRGSAFDVAVDLRRGSKSYLQHSATELSGDNGKMFYIPRGCAHGFQTLTDDTALLYFISDYYDPNLSRGIRWDDPRLAIPWPLTPTVMSARDRMLPLLGAG